MDIVSLILSAISVVLGLVSIYITLRLTKRTSELKEEIKVKYDRTRAAARFSEKRTDNINRINEVKDYVINNIDQELPLKTLDELYLIIKRIQNNIISLSGGMIDNAKKTIEDLKLALENTNYEPIEKNKIITELLRDTIVFLESYEYME